MSSIRPRAVSLAALSLLIVGLALPPAVAAAPPAGWAWVVARKPAVASYIPAAKDQGNVSGMSNTVNRLSAGRYEVVMPGANTSDGGGHMQVSAFGAPRFCTSFGWGPGTVASEMRVYVNCYTLAGVYSDSPFTAVFLTRGYNSGTIAYVWANDSTATDYTPNAFYASPTNITIHRSSSGHYLVRLPAFDASHGNIQISSYNGGPCNLGETSSDGTALIVGVVCLDGDTAFNLLYTKDVGLTGVTRPKAAYARVFPLRPAATRTPAEFRYSSVSGAPNVNRTGVGSYVVTLPGMPRGGVAHVTTGPGGAGSCWVAKIRTSGTPQKVGVSCAMYISGVPADAAFDLSYTK